MSHLSFVVSISTGEAAAELLGTGKGKRKTSGPKWGSQQQEQGPSFEHLPGGLGLPVSSVTVTAGT